MKKEYIYLMLLIVGVAVIYFVIKSIGKKPPTNTTTGGATAPTNVVTPSNFTPNVLKNYWIKKGGEIYAPDKGDNSYPPSLGTSWAANPMDDFRSLNAAPIFTATVDADLGPCKIIKEETFTWNSSDLLNPNNTALQKKTTGFILEYPNGKRRGIFAPYLFLK